MDRLQGQCLSNPRRKEEEVIATRNNLQTTIGARINIKTKNRIGGMISTREHRRMTRESTHSGTTECITKDSRMVTISRSRITTMVVIRITVAVIIITTTRAGVINLIVPIGVITPRNQTPRIVTTATIIPTTIVTGTIERNNHRRRHRHLR